MRGSEDGSYEITACRRRQMSLKVDSEILNMQQAIGTPKPSSPPSLSREKKLRRQEIALWNLLHDVDIVFHGIASRVDRLYDAAQQRGV